MSGASSVDVQKLEELRKDSSDATAPEKVIYNLQLFLESNFETPAGRLYCIECLYGAIKNITAAKNASDNTILSRREFIDLLNDIVVRIEYFVITPVIFDPKIISLYKATLLSRCKELLELASELNVPESAQIKKFQELINSLSVEKFNNIEVDATKKFPSQHFLLSKIREQLLSVLQKHSGPYDPEVIANLKMDENSCLTMGMCATYCFLWSCAINNEQKVEGYKIKEIEKSLDCLANTNLVDLYAKDTKDLTKEELEIIKTLEQFLDNIVLFHGNEIIKKQLILKNDGTQYKSPWGVMKGLFQGENGRTVTEMNTNIKAENIVYSHFNDFHIVINGSHVIALHRVLTPHEEPFFLLFEPNPPAYVKQNPYKIAPENLMKELQKLQEHYKDAGEPSFEVRQFKFGTTNKSLQAVGPSAGYKKTTDDAGAKNPDNIGKDKSRHNKV